MTDKMTVQERGIREDRVKIYNEMSEIMERLPSGELTVDDRTKFDTLEARLTELDADLKRVQQYNTLSEAREEAKDRALDSDPAPITGEVRAERAYESAFLKTLKFGEHNPYLTTEERQAWNLYSNPRAINRPPTEKHYEPYVDSHGTKRNVGYEDLRAADVQFEERATLDANALSTAPNSAGIPAGATGYDGGYLIPQGQGK